MNKRVIKGWLKRLRSGEYTQGQNHLRIEGDDYCNVPTRHCCLGVLCDMYAQSADGKRHKSVWDEGACDDACAPVEFRVKGENPQGQMPPRAVMRWAGIDEYDAAELAEMNDEGKTFKQIAQVIERKLTKED
jgi:hypothetical protein